MDKVQQSFDFFLKQLIKWSISPEFYIQIAVIFTAVIVAFIVQGVIKRQVKLFHSPPDSGRFIHVRQTLYNLQALLFSFSVILFLAMCSAIVTQFISNIWLIKIAQSLAVIFLLYRIITLTIKNKFIRFIFKWAIIPIAVLQIFGWLPTVSAQLDSIAITVGNIRISLLVLFRSAILGTLLFWLGRHSNDAGKKAIRRQEKLDIGTKELFAKLFEIGLFVVLFILLLQLIGINLTTLAVLGGAIGVGLGFGLQQIAANFISGIIILLDRAITVGDHIELNDERFGIVREIKMRYTVVESYAGKEHMIPNETFITNSFINWSRKDDKQRYSFTFSVSYHTDLHKLFDIVRTAVASHPQVISGTDAIKEELPDAEINEFGDSGVSILVEFWMHGIDDGRNRVEADLKLLIWDALKANGMSMPFPQREVRILGDQREK